MLLVTTQATTRLTHPGVQSWIICSKQKALQTLTKNISAKLVELKYDPGKAIKGPKSP